LGNDSIAKSLITRPATQDATAAYNYKSPPDRVFLKEVTRLSEHLVKLIGHVIVKAHDRQACTPS
jgi:hypothetical protein